MPLTFRKFVSEKYEQGYTPDLDTSSYLQGLEEIIEELELINEMPGANMDTRAVHSYLKKRGWELTRTSGSHDVYTHPKAPNNIAVPRHRQLKVPLIRGILKQAEIHEDWQKVNKADRTDGLSQKAVNAYRREHPGSRLQTAVTEKNPKGKRAARRKSFCSRMSGMKNRLTNAENARDPDSPINKALRRWNC